MCFYPHKKNLVLTLPFQVPSAFQCIRHRVTFIFYLHYGPYLQNIAGPSSKKRLRNSCLSIKNHASFTNSFIIISSIGTTMSLNLTVPKDSPKKVPRRAKSPGTCIHFHSKGVCRGICILCCLILMVFGDL